jgi:hypothetical protein
VLVVDEDSVVEDMVERKGLVSGRIRIQVAARMRYGSKT